MTGGSSRRRRGNDAKSALAYLPVVMQFSIGGALRGETVSACSRDIGPSGVGMVLQMKRLRAWRFRRVLASKSFDIVRLCAA